MAAKNEQRTLDRILTALKSGEADHCLQALEELNSLKFSSPAIVRELEQLALHHPDEEVRKGALQSLSTSVHQFVRRNINRLNRGDRAFILKQVEQWEDDGLLPSNIADVISARYDFDILTPQSVSVPTPVIEEARTPLPVAVQPAIPAGPRPTLTQTLLSEASIRIYLYLGAFFVIAAALILAAVVEAARLPILAVATLLFGGSALVLRKRLPQPSFALFIVFSFLLPIAANVFEETIGFSEPSLSLYWTFVFLGMATIWGFSVWLYESRFFSAVAFVSLCLAFYRAAKIFDTEIELAIFLGILASLAGLAGTFALKRWKDTKFSIFVFLLAQAQVLGLLLFSFAFAVIHVFNSDLANGWWMLVALTWLIAAFFFVLGDMLIPFPACRWAAVAALLPLPWFVLNTFASAQPVYAIGFFIWGAVFALGSEASQKLQFDKIKQYYPALLAGSALLFAISFSIAVEWEAPGLTFAIMALTALVYGALHWLRPRWYVWSAALLSATVAFFTFFHLPSIESLGVPFVFQLLILSVLLVVPELFAKSQLSSKEEARWPAIVLGIFISLFGITAALADLEHTGRGALTLISYAVLFTLHAFHSKHEWLGYFATALESLALVYALDYLDLDLWLPALTALSVVYYAAGFFFRRGANDLKPWGTVFVNSGLALGSLLSFAALFLSTESSGWYIILIALTFAVEVFARPFAWFEFAAEILLSISLYLILDDFSIFLFGASLIWLGGDLLFGSLIQQKRVYGPITLVLGFTLVVLAAFALWDEVTPVTPTIYYSLYALLFTGYALLQRKPRFGYLAAGFLPLAIIKFSEVMNFEKWIFPWILLAVVYYGSGYWLRRNQRAQGWDQMLVYSGLGLGVFTTIVAPSQGGLDASIPVTIAATLFAAEAYALRNVWWALPANAFYLLSYFMILWELKVDEPQFYSIGAALLGMLMHYLITRAGSKTGAFLAGMLSQLVLLGTTYIQMVSTERLSFFVVLFIQSMLVLVYGLIQRSRSLVITPIVFAVIGVMTVVYSALKGLGPVILIGSTGVLLLMAGIVAVLMRERITRLGEQLSDWKP